jgi:hypothetical protein
MGCLFGPDFRVWAYLLDRLTGTAAAWFAHNPFQRCAPRQPRSRQTSRSVAALLRFDAGIGVVAVALDCGVETLLAMGTIYTHILSRKAPKEYDVGGIRVYLPGQHAS